MILFLFCKYCTKIYFGRAQHICVCVCVCEWLDKNKSFSDCLSVALWRETGPIFWEAPNSLKIQSWGPGVQNGPVQSQPDIT
jgi:hypothetical protein